MLSRLFPLTVCLIATTLAGCATVRGLIGMETAKEVPEDPIEAAAMAYRSPSSLTEKPAPFLADAAADMGSPDQIRVGMAKSDVMSAWGRPSEIETAGNGQLGHERWVYFRGLSSRWGLASRDAQRVVYFEGGRVAGGRIG
jgi:outer membrane protein assembly factor BamE (lipoprotein component of BamABCDE complex)